MSFARILRSSALMGGAQVVVLAAAFVRAKIIAVILGASGVGLIGIFNAFSGNVASFAGWGLGTSGVRLIAGAPDELKPAKIAAVRRMSWVLSLLGLCLALLLFWPVGSVTFDSSQYVTEMAIVACAVPCVIAASGWSAILQASGKVASLAKVQIAGALAGLFLGLPSIWLWGTLGVALSILFAAAVPAFVLWRTASAECRSTSGMNAESEDLRRLIKLGGALMVVGWLGQLSAYLVRLAIVRQEGLDAAGYYQAAFAISGSLPGFVFAAMGADFFPRVAAAKDEDEARHITERQIQAGILLGVPLVMALLTLGKPSIRLLYAADFDAAIPLLAWMGWGVFLRLITWPIGFWLLARGSSRQVIGFEALGAVIAIVLPMVLLPRFGLVSASAAFAIAALIYGIAIGLTFRRKTGGWFSRDLHVWAIVATLSLAIGQYWTSTQDGEYVGFVPVIAASTACALVYLKEMRKA